MPMGVHAVKPKPILIDLLVIVAVFGIIWLVSSIPRGKRDREQIPPPKVAAEVPVADQSQFQSVGSAPGSYELDIPGDYTLAGISLRATGEEVISVLGEPLQKKRHSEDDYPNDGSYTLWVEIWTYDGLEITFSESVPSTDPEPTGSGTVDRITVTSGDYQTKDGVKVGDSFERLKELNPNPAQGGSVVTRTLQFTLTGGRVSEITLMAFSIE